MRPTLRLLLLAGALACGSPAGSNPDAGAPDGGGQLPDAGPGDGGNVPDAGATPDAGPTPDGGPTDGGLNDGGSPVACPGPFVLCEDFENGLDAGTWMKNGTGITLDSTRAHRGSYSLRVSTDNTNIRTTRVFPALAENEWGRVFVYMDQLPPGSTTVLTGPNSSFTWSAGGGGDTRLGFRHTRLSGGYNYPGYDFTNTDTMVWPQDQWVCVEWHYQSDGGQGTQDYWVNGQARPAMGFGPHPMPAFTYAWFGQLYFGQADGGGNFDIWMDDLVLDSAQVGCTQ